MSSEPVERLVSVALIRDGVTHHGHKEHWALRAQLDPNDSDPYKNWRGDPHGFWTSADRYVTREEALDIAVTAGQCRPQQRELLSSDVNW